jgi:metal-responsive CopG/Arc/MetJ family transcriptional regulator
MGGPPLNLTRLHVNLSPEDLARIDGVVGTYGRSKFICDTIRSLLDQIAPGEGWPSLSRDRRTS